MPVNSHVCLNAFVFVCHKQQLTEAQTKTTRIHLGFFYHCAPNWCYSFFYYCREITLLVRTLPQEHNLSGETLAGAALAIIAVMKEAERGCNLFHTVTRVLASFIGLCTGAKFTQLLCSHDVLKYKPEVLDFA